MNTYVTSEMTIELITDRCKLIDLDVPMDVPAVAVITSDECKLVLEIKLLQSIVAEFSKRQAASTSQS